jgi:hypothetical protein
MGKWVGVYTPSGAVSACRIDFGATNTGPWFTLGAAGTGVPYLVTSGPSTVGFVPGGGGPYARLNTSIVQTFTGVLHDRRGAQLRSVSRDHAAAPGVWVMGPRVSGTKADRGGGDGSLKSRERAATGFAAIGREIRVDLGERPAAVVGHGRPAGDKEIAWPTRGHDAAALGEHACGGLAVLRREQARDLRGGLPAQLVRGQPTDRVGIQPAPRTADEQTCLSVLRAFFTFWAWAPSLAAPTSSTATITSPTVRM